MSFTNDRLRPGPIISGMKEIGYGVAAPIPGAKAIGQDHTGDGHGTAVIGNSTDGAGDGNADIGVNKHHLIGSYLYCRVTGWEL